MGKDDFREDLITFSLLMGIISTFIKSIITVIPYYLKITNSMIILDIGKTIFNIDKVPTDPGHIILAFIGHLGFGGILAIGLSLVLLKTGTDFYYIKGGFYGVFVWLTLRNGLITVGMPGRPEPLDLITAVFSLISHVVYGLMLAYLIIKYNKFIRGTPGLPKK